MIVIGQLRQRRFDPNARSGDHKGTAVSKPAGLQGCATSRSYFPPIHLLRGHQRTTLETRKERAALEPLRGISGDSPDRGGRERAWFIRAHPKSGQRWLDDLQAAGFAAHVPERDGRAQ